MVRYEEKKKDPKQKSGHMPLPQFVCVCVLFFSSHPLFFWPHQAAWGTLVPQPGIEPVPPAVETWSLNH